MHLFAAIVPPRAIQDEVFRVVQSVDAPVPEPEPAKGLLRRFGGRGSASAASAAGAETASRELDRPPAEHLYLPITSFGNVTLGDSIKLAKALREKASTWSRPEVAFTGGAALEFPGDESVWAKLDGDLDLLREIGRGVPQVVQRLGFFVDRRQFRPWLSVGTITDETTAPYLEGVVAALDAFHGTRWTVEGVSLMRRPLDAASTVPFEEMELMPLAGN